jgi:putative ABC transport system permease protein
VGSPSGSIHVAATDNPTLVFERIFLDRTGSLETVDDALDAGSILISEPLANRLVLNRRPTSLELVTDTGLVEFPIAGIYYDYASSLGTVLMRLSTYRKHWSDQGVSALALRLHPTRDPEQISRELVSHFSTIQKVQVRPNRVLRQDALEVFDRTFAITRALRLLALIVAFIGILSALLSWQIEKQRELGILRAVGLTIRQVWALVLAETGLLGCVAGVLAIPTGLVMAWILIYIINLRSFGWTLQMQVDAWPFILAFVISVGASMLAGIIPARRLSQIQTSEALRSE